MLSKKLVNLAIVEHNPLNLSMLIYTLCTNLCFEPCKAKLTPSVYSCNSCNVYIENKYTLLKMQSGGTCMVLCATLLC